MSYNQASKWYAPPYSYFQILFYVVLIVIVRVVLELALLQYEIMPGKEYLVTRFFLENIYYFLIVFFITSLFVSKTIQSSLKEVMSFGVRLYPVICLPPIIDGLFFGRTGGYHYAIPENFGWNFFTLSIIEGDATVGICTEIVLALIGVFIYVYKKTHSILKAAKVFIFIDLLLVLISTPDLFFGKGGGSLQFDYFLPLYYFLPFLSVLICAMFFYNRPKLMAIFNNLRPARTFIFILAVLLGGCISYLMVSHIHSLNLFLAAFTIFLVWQVSVCVNDISDIDIDRVSNPSRPLVGGVVTIGDYKLMAVLLSFVAISFAMVIGIEVFFLTLLTLSFAYIYSVPPLRLRQNLWGNVVIGFSIMISFLIGFFACEKNFSAYTVIFTRNVMILTGLFLIYGIIIPLAKDIKDIEGDQKGQIKNLYTIYGKPKGKIITTALIFLAINLSLFVFAHFSIFLCSCLAIVVYYKYENICGVYWLSAMVIVMVICKLYGVVLS